jgi:Raf kinase inhibitor-like YbhB/YbcL family protein
MTLTSESFTDGQPCPPEFAFCVPSGNATSPTLSANQSPELTWADFPAATKSFALVFVDRDVPAFRDGVNEQGKTVAFDRERTDFYHWVLVDIPAGRTALHAGHDSDGVTPRGKDLRPTPYGTRGRNDYTGWFAGDADMEGVYGGYDGPCPPWNDERIHRYELTVYALDTETLGLDEDFGGADALRAMEGHVLDQASLTVTYHTYPDARPADG